MSDKVIPVPLPTRYEIPQLTPSGCRQAITLLQEAHDVLLVVDVSPPLRDRIFQFLEEVERTNRGKTLSRGVM